MSGRTSTVVFEIRARLDECQRLASTLSTSAEQAALLTSLEMAVHCIGNLVGTSMPEPIPDISPDPLSPLIVRLLEDQNPSDGERFEDEDGNRYVRVDGKWVTE